MTSPGNVRKRKGSALQEPMPSARPRRSAASVVKNAEMVTTSGSPAAPACPQSVLSISEDDGDEVEDSDSDFGSDTGQAVEVEKLSGICLPSQLQNTRGKIISKPIGKVWTHIEKSFDGEADKRVFRAAIAARSGA